MDEIQFVNLIDCNFPYNDRKTAVGLIDQANEISENAMFAVLDELCRCPHGTEVSRNTLLELVDIWADRIKHPLGSDFVFVAKLMIENNLWSVEDGLSLLDKVTPFKGLYAALSIVLESAEDIENALEVRAEKIRSDWDVGL